MKIININNEFFEYLDIQCQFSFGTHATLYLTFDLKKNAEYKSRLISLYESEKSFNIISNKFTSENNIIKSFDLDPIKSLITLTIRADYLITIPQVERRDNIIEDLLNDI